MSYPAYLTGYESSSSSPGEGPWVRTIEGFYGCRYPSILGDSSGFREEELRKIGFYRLSERAYWPAVSTRLIADLRIGREVSLWRSGQADFGGEPVLRARFEAPHPSSWSAAARNAGGLAIILGPPEEIFAPLPDSPEAFQERARRVWFLEAPTRHH